MIKKFVSIAGFILLCTFASQGQTVHDIFTNPNSEVTWFGIDYSHAKIVGKVSLFGGKTPVTAVELRDRYYPEWNQLILDEPEKYDIAKMIYRKSIVKDISMVKQLNAAVNLDSLEVPATPYYTQEKIQEFVSAYPIEKKAGIGLIFITECMDKAYGGAYYHVVFFNMETKEVLLQERVQGIVIGAGIRNYWAGSYFNVIEYIRDERYPRWKKRYLTAKPASTTTAPKW